MYIYLNRDLLRADMRERKITGKQLSFVLGHDASYMSSILTSDRRISESTVHEIERIMMRPLGYYSKPKKKFTLEDQPRNHGEKRQIIDVLEEIKSAIRQNSTLLARLLALWEE